MPSRPADATAPTEPDPGEEDRRLMARVAAMEESALRRLYEKHHGVLYALGLRILGDSQEAEEALQDTMVRAWRHGARYDAGRATVLTWLIMIHRNLCLDRLRVRRSRPPRSTEEGVLATVADPERLEAHLQSRDDGKSIRRKLGLLPVDQRRCIELAFYHGYTQSEIAATLNQPLGTIKARIRRGLIKMRTLLASHHD